MAGRALRAAEIFSTQLLIHRLRPSEIGSAFHGAGRFHRFESRKHESLKAPTVAKAMAGKRKMMIDKSLKRIPQSAAGCPISINRAMESP
jgi:hypothetical protein